MTMVSPIAFIAFVLGLTLLFTLLIPAEAIRLIRIITLGGSLYALFFGIRAYLLFNKGVSDFQFVHTFTTFEQYNLTFTLGVDGISMAFLLLTLLTFPVLFLAAWNVALEPKKYLNFLLAMELLLVLTFTTTDTVYFFILFESLLIPMFILIGVWGARDRKIKAAYYFFLYTLFGSLFMLFGIFYLYSVTGTTAYSELMQTVLEEDHQKIIWFCFFMAFAVKMPLFPFHIWLPEAHVEAPTTGSMLLASLLLKLGGYGFLRFSLTFLGEATANYNTAVSVTCILGVILGALATIRQIDLKRIIAYSSVSHMNLAMLGLISDNAQGVNGALYLMLSHGVVSTALFFCVGVLYDRYHTRLLRYYGGLAAVMPVFTSFLLIFSLANMGFPGTANFTGELATFQGIFNWNPTVAGLSLVSTVLGAIYAIWLYARVSFGTLKSKYITEFKDLTRRELVILVLLTGLMLFLALATGFVTELVHFSTHPLTPDFSVAVQKGSIDGQLPGGAALALAVTAAPRVNRGPLSIAVSTSTFLLFLLSFTPAVGPVLLEGVVPTAVSNCGVPHTELFATLTELFATLTELPEDIPSPKERGAELKWSFRRPTAFSLQDPSQPPAVLVKDVIYSFTDGPDCWHPSYDLLEMHKVEVEAKFLHSEDLLSPADLLRLTGDYWGGLPDTVEHVFAKVNNRPVADQVSLWYYQSRGEMYKFWNAVYLAHPEYLIGGVEADAEELRELASRCAKYKVAEFDRQNLAAAEDLLLEIFAAAHEQTKMSFQYQITNNWGVIRRPEDYHAEFTEADRIIRDWVDKINDCEKYIQMIARAMEVDPSGWATV